MKVAEKYAWCNPICVEKKRDVYVHACMSVCVACIYIKYYFWKDTMY